MMNEKTRRTAERFNIIDGEDYSLILRNYNDLIEEYRLPMSKIGWISNTEFEFFSNCRI